MAFAKHGNYKQVKWIENATNIVLNLLTLCDKTKK